MNRQTPDFEIFLPELPGTLRDRDADFFALEVPVRRYPGYQNQKLIEGGHPLRVPPRQRLLPGHREAQGRRTRVLGAHIVVGRALTKHQRVPV